MKKIVSILSILVLSVGSIMAQTSYKQIKGYVIDKYGNPIPGAEVTTPGGGESVITDSDGSFNITVHPLLEQLTATYDGMRTKTLKITPDKDLIFRLKKVTNNPAFINASIGWTHNIQYGYYAPTNGISFGIMSGMLGKWGFYGKFNCNLDGDLSITAGIIKSLYKRASFFYFGAGYGMANREYNQNNYGTSYGWEVSDKVIRPGVAGDLGFIFKIGRHFNFSVGYNIICTFPFEGKAYNLTEYDYFSTSTVGDNFVHGVQLGLGYVF